VLVVRIFHALSCSYDNLDTSHFFLYTVHNTEEPVLYSANPNTITANTNTASGNVMMVLVAVLLMGAMYLLGKHSK